MIKERQIRTLKACEIRSEESDGKRYIYGFIPYGQKSQKMWLGYSGDMMEVLDRSVFAKTLGDKANVYANFSHDDSKILGSTKAGTLELVNTDSGLNCRCLLPNTTWGNDAWEIISRGDVTTMSFEFIPYEWEEGYEKDTTLLKSAKLDAVSFCVSHPAYTQTDSMTSFRCLCKDIDMDKVNKTLNGEENDKEEVKKLIRSLESFIDNEDAESDSNIASSEQPEDTQTDTELRDDNAQTEIADATPQNEGKDADAENEKAKQERDRLALELELSLAL